MWENATPSTEFPRDFCAGIGPLQLGVVLVLISSYIYIIFNVENGFVTYNGYDLWEQCP